ncbi:hypothetical protein BD410DRAFT_818864 [Rickenella mellea]|uniref:PIN domain-containing protein n=1 Tax=Rickenella mellea TaxID=50990 RepID=A0A4Y7QJA5_9AGAM|nr:hypothetical protein BD410DRAFT_818864 [Rickenella mellea]
MQDSRKGKERDLNSPDFPQFPQHSPRRTPALPQPAPTDLADRMIAFQRRQAAVTRPRERSERPAVRTATPATPATPPAAPPTSPRKQPPASPPQLIVSRTDSVEVEEASRRRKPPNISPRANHTHASSSRAHGKLFNPDADPIPIRRTAEPESMSDNGSSSYAPRAGPSKEGAGQAGRLFDHRKDDPVRFNVLARPSDRGRPHPTPKSSGEYVSASSTSSYAHSITSSNFTLSSTTDGSSASSALFEQQPREETGSSAFAVQLKKLYRVIMNVEAKALKLHGREAPEVSLRRPNHTQPDSEAEEQEKWSKFVAEHKTLAESMHNLLQLTSAPLLPASLRNIPTKYNIITRLWTHAFNMPLETLRRASFQSVVALEHLQDYLYYAYKFYSMLLEERNLDVFKSGWLEALGDLARYRMAIAAMTAPAAIASGEFQPISEQALTAEGDSDDVPARIDDSPGPSVGVAAARALDVEPEVERWRHIARDWYAAGLADTPGTGKLHHHLGLLSREVDGGELRAVYHFVKSMTTLHPFSTSRESVLPIWSAQAQARRSQPDAHVSDLFVLLHGMLFTNIELDDFPATLARLMERLELEGAEEREWIMMAVINITAILEYGRPTGVLRRTGAIGAGGGSMSTAAQAAAANAKVNLVVRRLDQMEVDDVDTDDKVPEAERADEDATDDNVRGNGIIDMSPLMAQNHADSDSGYPLSFKHALQLTFTMFAHTLRKPTRKATPFARTTLNPYNTVILTFLVTVLKHAPVLAAVERAVPWEDLAAFCTTIPRSIIGQAEGGVRLTSGCSPLSEDWCLRGMEWGGRRVYERGFWKAGEERHAEMEVLCNDERDESATDGIIEDENDDGKTNGKAEMGETSKRWVRIARAATGIAKVVPGFEKATEGTRRWSVNGVLAEKVERWKEDERLEQEEEERRRSRRWIDDHMDMDVDDEEEADEFSEDSDDDDDDSEEVKLLKARRRELRQLLQTAQRGQSGSPPHRRSGTRKSRNGPTTAGTTSLSVVAGYTVLIVDTNILLSSLSIFASLVESLQWTIVVPLAVITELDGLAANSSPLGEAASAATAYIVAHLRSHGTSLKVQTSKGNYLSTLIVRNEQVEFSDASWERNMDDLILRAAVWHDDHWVDRSAILSANVDERDTTGAAKVVLLSFDRNLRLKARARQLDAADEKDMAEIFKA